VITGIAERAALAPLDAFHPVANEALVAPSLNSMAQQMVTKQLIIGRCAVSRMPFIDSGYFSRAKLQFVANLTDGFFHSVDQDSGASALVV
jgi:hypothetical protein